jgi:hypothetical protein
MRVHLNAPRWLLNRLSRWIAQPDALFVMLADPEVIFRRKPELTAEEISRQQEVLTGLTLPTSVHIDTSISLEKSLQEALEAIARLLCGDPLAPSRAPRSVEDFLKDPL